MVRRGVVRLGLTIGLIVAVGVLAAAAAGEEEKRAGEQAEKVPSAAIAKPLVVPDSEKQKKNPVPRVPEALESGKVLYNSQCSMCHGVKGDGRGDFAVSKQWKIPNYADPAVQARRTDGELFYILSRGHGQMPAEKRLADQSKWEIVLYMRSLVLRAVAASPAAKK